MPLRQCPAPIMFPMLAMLISVLLLSILIDGQASICRAAVIVLDPGHGGQEIGAGRGSSFPEKRFNLALARKVADRLAGRHRVELTRTTDIAMDPHERASLANQLRSELLVCLHAGSPPYCSEERAFVFVHDDRHKNAPQPGETGAADQPADPALTPWSQLQTRHIPVSRKIAETVAHALRQREPFGEVTVAGAPLAVLMGADRPAILVEVGCILTQTAPPLEAIETRLDQYARAIAEAIEAALPELPH